MKQALNGEDKAIRRYLIGRETARLERLWETNELSQMDVNESLIRIERRMERLKTLRRKYAESN